MKNVEPIVSKLFEVCEHADFSNGVTAEGMDEGRVYAYRLICELKQKWELLSREKPIALDGSQPDLKFNNALEADALDWDTRNAKPQ